MLKAVIFQYFYSHCFNERYDLFFLQAVHTKEKNYQCTICSRSFAIPSYLKTHMIRVHGMVETSKASMS